MSNPAHHHQNPPCPQCQCTFTTKRGKRHNRLQTLQVFQCAECLHRFTREAGRNKTYPLRLILETVSTFNLGHSTTETQQILRRRFHRHISERTINSWLTEGDVVLRKMIDGRKTTGSAMSSRVPGRAVARTGLRMMPTFPPLPLKSRTAGFPQYGFKADISDGAFPSTTSSSHRTVCLRPSCTSLPVTSEPRSESRNAVRWYTTVQTAIAALPQGPSLPPSYAVSAINA
jgi:transposase-like protein